MYSVFYIEVSKVKCHHRLHRFHRFWLCVVDAITQIDDWITAANAAMIKQYGGICEILIIIIVKRL